MLCTAKNTLNKFPALRAGIKNTKTQHKKNTLLPAIIKKHTHLTRVKYTGTCIVLSRVLLFGIPPAFRWHSAGIPPAFRRHSASRGKCCANAARARRIPKDGVHIDAQDNSRILLFGIPPALIPPAFRRHSAGKLHFRQNSTLWHSAGIPPAFRQHSAGIPLRRCLPVHRSSAEFFKPRESP